MWRSAGLTFPQYHDFIVVLHNNGEKLPVISTVTRIVDSES
jgi:hypothetical protein